MIVYLVAAGIWRKIEAHPKGHTANLIHDVCSEPAGAGGALQEPAAGRDPSHGRTRFRLWMCCSGTVPKQSQLSRRQPGSFPPPALASSPQAGPSTQAGAPGRDPSGAKG